jgi:hypothetical protein
VPDLTGSSYTPDLGSTYDFATSPDLAGADQAPPPDLGVCDDVAPPGAPTLPLPAAGKVVDGTGRMVDLFVTAQGIVVVSSTAVILFSRAGVELARWTSLREIRAAAFDEQRLAIADRGPSTGSTCRSRSRTRCS